LVGEVMARLPVHAQTRILDHLLGLGGQQMAMDVDREPFAAGMHRPRKAAGDLRSFGQAGEQHRVSSRDFGQGFAHPTHLLRGMRGHDDALTAGRTHMRSPYLAGAAHGGAMIGRAADTIRKWTETARTAQVRGLPMVLDMLEWAYGRAIAGVPGLDGAEELAKSYTARCATTDE